MYAMTREFNERVGKVVERLSALSVRDHYNPYETFQWPLQLPTDELWISEDLLSVYGTDEMTVLSRDELARLSRWESVNFYSLNVHGIRELLIEVIMRIHEPGYETLSPFLHHFIGEENDHMWFFAEFCLRYGGKLYPNKNIKMEQKFDGKALDVITFAKIQLFEEIVDYFNAKVAADDSIHPFIRQINRIHHRDESRHIAFGREIVASLYEEVKASAGEDTLKAIDEYLRGYLLNSVGLLYNPKAYQDAGLPGDPYERRKKLLQDKGRLPIHKAFLQKPEAFLLKHEIIRQPVVA